MTDASDKGATRPDVEGEKPETQVRREEYNSAIRTARLAALVLSSVTFKVDRSLSIRPGEKPVVSCKGQVCGFGYHSEKGECFTEVEWSVVMKVARKNYAVCKAEYHVGYDGLAGVEESVVQLVAENLAQPATFAYFRSLYANLDWAAAIGTPPLPLIKFMPRLFGNKPRPIIASHS